MPTTMKMKSLLFDTDGAAGDALVIVPPKPEFAYETHDEFSYSNLYCYDGAPGGPAPSAGEGEDAGGAATAAAAPVGSGPDGAGVLAPAAASAAAATAVASADPTVPGEDPVAAAASTEAVDRRDPRKGAFTFQVHAEYDLLLHVQRALDEYRRKPRPSRGSCACLAMLAEVILRSIDEYCLKEQWMYHIGREKGVAIGRFLRTGAEQWRKRHAGDAAPAPRFTCVDLGTYCGYSALVLASTLRQVALDAKAAAGDAGGGAPFDFHIYTTEVSSKVMNVAQTMFRLARVDARVTPILVEEGTDAEALSATLRDRGVKTIDFLLLDHAKDRYLKDLRDLEDAGMLTVGSRVSADNVVFNRLDAYREHMQRLQGRGLVTSRLEEMNLEYSNNLKDGIEMTVYLKDPPTQS